MPYNFRSCDRSQQFLLPLDMREWLPEDHLAFFVLETVKDLDLGTFYASYRPDGWGRAAFDPEMMVALILYAFSVGERSSRRIERRCLDDVAFRVITANHTPDHSTIARFIARHHDALQGLFIQVIGVCTKAGLVRSATVAVDGTKLRANAAEDNNLSQEQLADYARRVFDEAAATDADEDRLYGEHRGDELHDFLRDPAKREEWIREQLAEQQRSQRESGDRRRHKRTARVNTTDPDSRVMKSQEGFIQGYNAQAVVTEDQVVIAAEVTNRAGDSESFQPMVMKAQDNLKSAGAQRMRTALADAGYFSAANLKADLGCDALIAPVATRHLAARIALASAIDPNTLQSIDLEIQRTRQRLKDEDDRRIDVLTRSLSREMSVSKAASLLGLSQSRASTLRSQLRDLGPDSIRRHRLRPKPRGPGVTEVALARFASPEVRQTYKRRSVIIEPVFGQIKEARGYRKFLRRGLKACNTEWMLVLTTHNLGKAWAVHREQLLNSLLRRISLLRPHPV